MLNGTIENDDNAMKRALLASRPYKLISKPLYSSPKELSVLFLHITDGKAHKIEIVVTF